MRCVHGCDYGKYRLATVLLAFALVFAATGIGHSRETAGAAQPAESFTFDTTEEIYGQMGKLYDYYELTHNFEETHNIFYSYVSQAINVLSKTNYENGNESEKRELLVSVGEMPVV